MSGDKKLKFYFEGCTTRLEAREKAGENETFSNVHCCVSLKTIFQPCVAPQDCASFWSVSVFTLVRSTPGEAPVLMTGKDLMVGVLHSHGAVNTAIWVRSLLGISLDLILLLFVIMIIDHVFKI